MGANSQPINIESIRAMFAESAKRGIDATGIALAYRNGDVRVRKDNIPATRFIGEKRHMDWVEENLTENCVSVLGHTRAWTKGSASIEKNNHPLYHGRTAVIHNGVISNDDWLFTQMGVERHAETDSDIIRAVLDRTGFEQKVGKELSKMCGAAAIAAVHPGYPGKVLLGRSGSPLVLAVLEEENQLWWASTKEALYLGARSWKERWKIWYHKTRASIGLHPFKADTLWLVGDEGVEWHAEMRISSGWERQVSYSNLHERFTAKKKQENEAQSREHAKVEPAGPVVNKVDEFVCRNPGCNTISKLTKRQLEKPLWTLRCADCKTSLAEPPKGN